MFKSLTHSLTFLALLVTTYEAIASEYCDISGLDKVAVVRALWQGSCIASAAKRFTPALAACTDVSNEDIREALMAGYIDYLQCRVIKADFHEDRFSVVAYDRDNGRGAAQRVIAKLRSNS